MTSNVQPLKTPKGTLARMQAVHLGKILFNLQFIALAVMLASVLSFIGIAVYYIMLVAISLLTVFTIYAIYPNFVNAWTGGEKLANIAVKLAQSWTYTIPIVICLAALSIGLLCFDKNEKHIARIVVSSIIIVIALILLILQLTASGGAN